MSAFQGFNFVNQAGQNMRDANQGMWDQINSNYKMHMDEYNRDYERLADVRRRVFDPTMQKMVGQIYDASIGNVLTNAIEKQKVDRDTALALQRMESQDKIQQRGADKAKEFLGLVPGVGEPGSPHAGPPKSLAGPQPEPDDTTIPYAPGKGERKPSKSGSSDTRSMLNPEDFYNAWRAFQAEDGERDVRQVDGPNPYRRVQPVWRGDPEEGGSRRPQMNPQVMYAEFDKDGNEIPGSRSELGPQERQMERFRKSKHSQGSSAPTKRQQQQAAVDAVRTGSMTPPGGMSMGPMGMGGSQPATITYNPYTGQPILVNPATGATLQMTHEGVDGMISAMKANAALEKAQSDLQLAESVQQRAQLENHLAYKSDQLIGRTAIQLSGLPDSVKAELMSIAHTLSPKDIENLEKGLIDKEALRYSKQESVLQHKLNGLEDEIKTNRAAIDIEKQILAAELKAANSGSDGGNQYGDMLNLDGETSVEVTTNDPIATERAMTARSRLNNLLANQRYLQYRRSSFYRPSEYESNSLAALASDPNSYKGPLDSIERVAASIVTGTNDPELALRNIHYTLSQHPGGVEQGFMEMYVPAIKEAALAAGWEWDFDPNANGLDAAEMLLGRFMDHTQKRLDMHKFRETNEKLLERDNRPTAEVRPGGPTYRADDIPGFAAEDVSQEATGDAEGERSYLSDYVQYQGVPELDESTSMTQGQISDVATMMGVSDDYAREYLSRYREQYGLDTAGMQRYHANLTSGVERPGDYEGEPLQQRDKPFEFMPTEATAESKKTRPASAMDVMEGMGPRYEEEPNESAWASDLVREVNESWAPGLEKRFDEYAAGLPGLKEADVRELIEPTMSKLESWVNDFVRKTQDPKLELKPQAAKDYDTMMGVIDSVVDLLPMSEEKRFEKLVDVISDRKTQEALDSRMEEAAKLEELLRFMSNYSQHNDKWDRLKNLREGQFGRGGVSGDSELGQNILDKQKMALQWLETGQNPYKNK